MSSNFDDPAHEPDPIAPLLRERLPRHPAPARLRVAVAETFDPPKARRRPSLWLVSSFSALATAMVMLLWLAPLLPRSGTDPMQRLTHAATSEYARAVFADEVRRDTVPGTLPRAMEESGVVLNWVFVGDAELRLVDAQLAFLEGRRALALTYRDGDGHSVSYLIARGPNVAIPEGERVQIARWRPVVRKEEGFSLIVWKQSGLVCVMVSDLVSEADLGRFKEYFVKVRSSTELSQGN